MKLVHRVLLIACSICITVTGVVQSKPRLVVETQVRDHSASLDTPWRMTKDGWQDSRSWRDIQSESTAPEPVVHPVFWTLGVLLLALGTMIWANEEDNAEQAKKRATAS